jgi:putative flippase GtrA
MERTITSALDIWHRFTLSRYLLASVVALGCDVAVYFALVGMSLDTTFASALGYSIGIIVHWLISSQIVFVGKLREGTALHLQRALFAGSALLGLGITVGIVAMFTSMGSDALTAKIAAIIVSFIAVYATRKWGVFK